MKVGMHAEEIVMAWLSEHPIAGCFSPRQSIGESATLKNSEII